MNTLKKMAVFIDIIPEGRIYVDFVSPYSLGWCVQRLEKWDQFHDVFKQNSGWWVTVSAISEDTAVFTVSDLWGRRRGLGANGILHRLSLEETRVLIVETSPREARYGMVIMMGIFIFSIFGALYLGFSSEFGSSAFMCVVVLFFLSILLSMRGYIQSSAARDLWQIILLLRELENRLATPKS